MQIKNIIANPRKENQCQEETYEKYHHRSCKKKINAKRTQMKTSLHIIWKENQHQVDMDEKNHCRSCGRKIKIKRIQLKHEIADTMKGKSTSRGHRWKKNILWKENKHQEDTDEKYNFRSYKTKINLKRTQMKNIIADHVKGKSMSRGSRWKSSLQILWKENQCQEDIDKKNYWRSYKMRINIKRAQMEIYNCRSYEKKINVKMT